MSFIMVLGKNSLLCLLLLCFFIACGDKDNNLIEASGVLEAIEVDVGSKLQGKIISIDFEEGSLVRQGDVLARIDCIDYELQVNQAKANLDMMQAQYELVIKGARIEDIEQADSAMKQAESRYHNAETEYERIRNLFEKNVVPKKMLDDAKTQLDIVDAQFKQAQQAMKKIRRLSREEEIAMASARVEQAKWSLKLAEQRVKDCEIISPMNGVVLTKVFEAGEYVMAGSTIATIANLQKLNAIVYLPETEVFLIKYGQEAKIKIDAFADRIFEGKVIYISSEAEFSPKNIQAKDERVKLMFEVKVLVENPEMILKPGLPADVEFVR